MLVNLRISLLFRAVILLAALGVQTNTAAAEAKFPSYLVDILVEECMALKTRKTHAVYAFSPLQVGFCTYGSADLPTQREQALERCTRQIPMRLRKSVECSIIVEDGRVVNRSLLSSSRKAVSAPADIEIFDGETRTTEKRRGLISTGRYVSLTHQAASITLDDGSVLCEGFRVEQSSGLGFEGKCFGKFDFKGSLPRPSGVFLYKGNYVAKISFKMKKGKSYIKVTTGE